jgi:hypothetical protein
MPPLGLSFELTDLEKCQRLQRCYLDVYNCGNGFGWSVGNGGLLVVVYVFLLWRKLLVRIGRLCLGVFQKGVSRH